MLKVVHISSYLSGGAGRAAFRLHEALLEQPDVQSTFITPSSNINGLAQNIVGVEPSKRTTLHKISNRLGLPVLNSQKNFRRLNKLKGDFEMFSMPTSDYCLENLELIQSADVINLHWISNFVNYPTFFKKFRNKPIVWTLHDMNSFMGGFHYRNDFQKNPHYHSLDADLKKVKFKSLNEASNLNIVTPSLWLVEEAISSNQFKTNTNFQVIPYGIDLKVFKPVDQKEAKRKLKIDPNLPCILIVADFLNTYRKGFDMLYEAIISMSGTTDFQLLTIGNGTIDLGGKVKLIELGKVENDNLLTEAYSAADLFILPSREDNLPNVMLEAFACGTPVLSFKTGGMHEWIIPTLNGMFSNTLDTQGLRTAIEMFIEEKPYFDRLKIRDFALDNFSSEIQAEKYLRLYNAIC